MFSCLILPFHMGGTLTSIVIDERYYNTSIVKLLLDVCPVNRVWESSSSPDNGTNQLLIIENHTQVIVRNVPRHPLRNHAAVSYAEDRNVIFFISVSQLLLGTFPMKRNHTHLRLRSSIFKVYCKRKQYQLRHELVQGSNRDR